MMIRNRIVHQRGRRMGNIPIYRYSQKSCGPRMNDSMICKMGCGFEFARFAPRIGPNLEKVPQFTAIGMEPDAYLACRLCGQTLVHADKKIHQYSRQNPLVKGTN